MGSLTDSLYNAFWTWSSFGLPSTANAAAMDGAHFIKLLRDSGLRAFEGGAGGAGEQKTPQAPAHSPFPPTPPLQ